MKRAYEYVETEEYEKGFADYYTQHIVPLALTFEENRSNRKFERGLGKIIAIALSICSILIMSRTDAIIRLYETNPRNYLIFVCPTIFFWWILVRKPKRIHFQIQKQQILPKILDFFGDFSYSSEGKLPSRVKVMHLGCEQKRLGDDTFEDKITYKIGDTKCIIAEETYSSLFSDNKKGETLILCFKFPQNLNANFIIHTANKTSAHHRENVKRLISRRGLTKTELPHSTGLIYLFNLHARGNIDKKWLSENLLNELSRLNTAFGKKGLTFSVLGSEVVVQIRTTYNLFETGVSYKRRAVNAQDIKKLLKDLNFALNLSETVYNRLLKLDTDINGETKSALRRDIFL